MRPFGYVLLLSLVACTTMHPIDPSPKEAKRHFTTGDIIKVYTKDETYITFEVVEVTDKAIVGVHEQIPFQDILKIEKEELSAAKTNLPGNVTLFSLYGTLVIATVALLLVTAL